MKHRYKLTKPLKAVFSTMISLFFIVLCIIILRPRNGLLRKPLLLVGAFFALLLLILGIVLIVMAVRSKLDNKLKIFLIMMGGAAAGFFVFAVLHNLVYGIMMILFGPEFWGPQGDEAVFFTLAVLVCPLVYIVGTIGSLVMIIKRRR